MDSRTAGARGGNLVIASSTQGKPPLVDANNQKGPNLKAINNIPPKINSNQLLKAALWYSKKGWSVIPIGNNKKPIIKWEQYQHRRATEQEIKAWWAKWPNANIGIVTGAISGLVVMDIDPRHNGNDSLDELIEENGALPDTVESITGGGGRHILFKHPGEHVESGAHKLGQGIDVKADGGYIIVPPSLHPSGNHYEWELSSRPDSTELAVIPPWLKEKLGEVKRKAEPIPDIIPDGQRNSVLTSLAGSVRHRGGTKKEILAVLKEANNRCIPPLAESELKAIAESVSRYAPSPSTQYTETDKLDHNTRPEVAKNRISSNLHKSTQIYGNELPALKTWAEALAESPEDREWTVQGILPKVGLAVIGGAPKAGKTTLMIELVRCIAQGLPVLGRNTLKAPVIYCNYEIPADYRAVLLEAGELPENATWIDRPVSVLSDDVIAHYINEANDKHKTDHGVFVIDTIRGAFRLTGNKENETGGIGIICRDLQKQAIDTGWLIIAIHHTNKANELAGNNDISAAADVIMLWRRKDKTAPGSLELEGRMPPVEPMAIQLVPGKAEHVGTAKQANMAEYVKRVYEVLTDDPVTADQVAEGLQAEGVNITATSARIYLGQLFSDSLIERIGQGKRGDQHKYFRANGTKPYVSVYKCKNEIYGNNSPAQQGKQPEKAVSVYSVHDEGSEEPLSIEEIQEAFNAEIVPDGSPF